MTERAFHRRQHFLAISLGILCLATAAWLGHWLWRSWIENWHIAKLAADDPGEREAAVAKLASLGSARAVPQLIESMARSPQLKIGPPGRGWFCGNAYDEYYATWQGKCSSAIDAAGIEALPHLRAKLRAGEATERFWAAHQIGELGNEARDAAGEVLPVLADQDPLVRSAAAEAIAAIGWRRTDAMASLRQILESAEGPDEQRAAAAEALGAAAWRALGHHDWASEVEKGEDTLERFLAATGSPPAAIREEALAAASSAVEALVEAARRGETPVRRAATSALNEVLVKQQSCEGLPPDGPLDLVPVFTALARDQDAVVRAVAVSGLSPDDEEKLGEPVLQALAEALRDADPEVRKVAAEVLRGKTEAVAILPALAAALGDPEDAVRSCASATLGGIGTPAVSVLIRVLKEDQPAARSAACDALAAIGAEAREAWARLFDVLADGREDVSQRAAAALGTIGAAAGFGVPELTRALKSPDPRVRRGAADALGRYGKEAATAGPALLEALDDNDPAVQAEAVLSLTAVGGVLREPFQAKVLSLLRDARTADVRYGAAVAVRQLAQTAAAAVPLLIPCLADPDESVRWTAAHALGAIGPAAREAVPALIHALDDPNPSANQAATAALGHIGADARAAVPVLLSRLDGEKNGPLRDRIVALGAIGEAPDRVVPALRRLLLDRDSRLAGETAAALAAFGEKALPALTEALEYESSDVRMAAARALERMGPRARAVVPHLERALQRDKEGWVKKSIEKAIAGISRDPAEGSSQAESGR